MIAVLEQKSNTPLVLETAIFGAKMGTASNTARDESFEYRTLASCPTELQNPIRWQNLSVTAGHCPSSYIWQGWETLPDSNFYRATASHCPSFYAWQGCETLPDRNFYRGTAASFPVLYVYQG